MSEEKKRLADGNRRFISKHGAELDKHIAGQNPFAAVLTCSDSRVPPELIFDVGIGEIFVVRDAGNIAIDPSEIGSLEYAVEHLRVPLIVVMGHTCCGALNAAENGPGDSSCVGEIVNEIRCCFGESDHLRANVRMQIAHLMERSQAISKAVKDGTLKIMGAVYHLEDGTVEFLN
ncbi:MAG: carbonic anhydrase [Candidatus Thermoplasmatota archaeon]|nr:carbonic anhydrase [Euryarchaeota archaeon]MBU4032921.1 carbonic anhydrase [Candidatus Thermoplasmatota archaeon]MBU4070807.1 carbonic anhydrase [Candidatus Thermoplasmatota archaeon]MBU4143528.1 carbonic anhydrase [Candidatus Thermoplasmatota archaeon]MBU4591641.1 carbonic anhydrase [Candidatus Thermoplasmatota archaeon]